MQCWEEASLRGALSLLVWGFTLPALRYNSKLNAKRPFCYGKRGWLIPFLYWGHYELLCLYDGWVCCDFNTLILRWVFQFSQFSSVAQSCPTLCDLMNCSTPGLPVHQLPEFTQTHVHRVGDAFQPSHPLPSPSPPAPALSQHLYTKFPFSAQMIQPQFG